MKHAGLGATSKNWDFENDNDNNTHQIMHDRDDIEFEQRFSRIKTAIPGSKKQKHLPVQQEYPDMDAADDAEDENEFFYEDTGEGNQNLENY